LDFRLYGRVLWRFKLIVITGFILAVALAIFSVVRVSSHGLTYRDSRLWSASMQLQVTQAGAPDVRLYAQRASTDGDQPTEPASPGPPVVDPARFATLAIYYSRVISSDPVRRLANRDDGIRAKIIATPERDDNSGVLLPYIDVLSIATTPQAAIRYSERTAAALSDYILARQKANHVAPSDRAVVQTMVHPRGADVYRSRPKTMAIVVFLAVMFATIGLAFVLENARPRRRDSQDADSSTGQDTQRRRSA
jgi:hypothetical protein